MTVEQILLLVAGVLLIILGPITGLLFKTLKGQRLVNKVGDSVARVIYLAIGIVLIIISLFVAS